MKKPFIPCWERKNTSVLKKGALEQFKVTSAKFFQVHLHEHRLMTLYANDRTD
jgi:hypothetical protein